MAHKLKISEEDVIGQCRALLELNGARVHRIVERIPWGRKTSTPGIPDVVGWFTLKPEAHNYGMHHPLHFWIEFKRPGAKLRPAQARWIQDAQQDGVIAFMADSVETMVESFQSKGIAIKGL